jgi:2,4-didehydro-3-deoxy-L-rhamnonate hydrolase
MKLMRHGPAGAERPGLIDDHGVRRDLSGVVDDIADAVLTREWIARLRALDASTLPIVDPATRIGAPVGTIGKFICVGLNFADHARESGMQPPEQPILFMKATSAVCGPDDALLLPPGAEKVDWEVELGVVIGDLARNVTPERAMNHVAGYCLIHDVSERAFQLEHGGQWVKGKSYDSFGPIGPFLATADEIADPHALAMTLAVNGETMQSGTTADMIFQVPALVSIISRYMTLHPGDVISTGTPAGVGLGMKPPRYLKEGDVVELAIDRLGRQRQVAQRDRRG